MLSDIINIFLPVLSHWIIWLLFFIAVIIVLVLYYYPYTKKPWKEFSSHHIAIPIASVISLYIFTKMLEGFIYQGSILKVDAWFNKISYSQLITSIGFFITNFGGTLLITLLFTITVALLFLKKRWKYAVLSAIALLGAVILQVVIKALVHRARPENIIESGFSFPSGHAITAIVFVSLLIYSFKDDFKNKITKYVLITLFSAFFIAVGISRLILHVHWFSDVVGGMSLGIFWFMLVILVERSIPSVVPAIKTETKEAKPIVPKTVVKTAKSVPKTVVKTAKAIVPEVLKK